jgi:hypothetical protein
LLLSTRHRTLFAPIFVYHPDDDKDETQEPDAVDVGSSLVVDQCQRAENALDHEDKKGAGKIKEQTILRFLPKADKV